MKTCYIIPFSGILKPRRAPAIPPVFQIAIIPHHPQNSPITSAYKLHPYVATMFKNIRRLGDIESICR